MFTSRNLTVYLYLFFLLNAARGEISDEDDGFRSQNPFLPIEDLINTSQLEGSKREKIKKPEQAQKYVYFVCVIATIILFIVRIIYFTDLKLNLLGYFGV